VAWSRGEGSFLLEVTVPQLVEAHVQLPGSTTVEVVGAGKHRFEGPDPLDRRLSGLGVAEPATRPLADVLDLLGDEEAWAEFSRAYQELTGGGEESLLGILRRLARTPLSWLPEMPVGPGGKQLPPEERAGLAKVVSSLQQHMP
jgi:hypothetical protein